MDNNHFTLIHSLSMQEEVDMRESRHRTLSSNNPPEQQPAQPLERGKEDKDCTSAFQRIDGVASILQFPIIMLLFILTLLYLCRWYDSYTTLLSLHSNPDPVPVSHSWRFAGVSINESTSSPLHTVSTDRNAVLLHRPHDNQFFKWRKFAIVLLLVGMIGWLSWYFSKDYKEIDENEVVLSSQPIQFNDLRDQIVILDVLCKLFVGLLWVIAGIYFMLQYNYSYVDIRLGNRSQPIDDIQITIMKYYLTHSRLTYQQDENALYDDQSITQNPLFNVSLGYNSKPIVYFSIYTDNSHLKPFYNQFDYALNQQPCNRGVFNCYIYWGSPQLTLVNASTSKKLQWPFWDTSGYISSTCGYFLNCLLNVYYYQAIEDAFKCSASSYLFKVNYTLFTYNLYAVTRQCSDLLEGNSHNGGTALFFFQYYWIALGGLFIVLSFVKLFLWKCCSKESVDDKHAAQEEQPIVMPLNPAHDSVDNPPVGNGSVVNSNPQINNLARAQPATIQPIREVTAQNHPDL